MLSVSDRVTNNLKERWISQNTKTHRVLTHIFEEDLKDTAGLFVDEARNTLHTTTTGETTNGGLGDTLDVVTKDFAMTLSTTLAKSLKLSSIARYKGKKARTLPFHLFHGRTFLQIIQEVGGVVFEK